MTAYFTAQLNVKNPEKLAEYSKKAAPIIVNFGGKLLFKSSADDIFSGVTALPNLAVFEFPDKEAIERFYTSKEYQRIISLREEAAEMVLSAHQVA